MNKRKKKCGIYCIENLVNGKRYIGQSVDIYMRFANHKSHLNRNIHINQYLQNAWNKYGKDKFKFYTIEKCDENLLNEREIYWINFYGTEKSSNLYNIAEGGYQNPYSGLTEEKRQAIYKKRGQIVKQNGSLKGGNNGFSKRVICLNTMEIFNSGAEANEKYGLSQGLVQACASGRRKSAGVEPITNNPLMWDYYDENKIYIYELYIHLRYKSVICLNTKEVFKNTSDASRWCCLKGSGNISNCCKGIREYAGKHPITGESLDWMYYDEYLEGKDKEVEFTSNYKKRVKCINTNEIFDSISDACRKYNIKSISGISRACKGEIKYSGIHPTTGEKLKWEFIK